MNYLVNLKKNDSEFYEIFKNFAFGELFEHSNLNKESRLVIFANLIVYQSHKTFKKNYCKFK